jgi:hypothetical protein
MCKRIKSNKNEKASYIKKQITCDDPKVNVKVQFFFVDIGKQWMKRQKEKDHNDERKKTVAYTIEFVEASDDKIFCNRIKNTANG